MDDRPTCDAPSAGEYADGLLDGWALAAALGGEAPAARGHLAPALDQALEGRLASLEDPATKVAALRAWSARIRPSVGADRLREAPPALRALLAPLATAGTRAAAADALRDLPSPRRGYRPPAGLATALARSAPRPEPDEGDRGRGRRLLAALGETAPPRLLERAGVEAAAVEQLAALEGGGSDGAPQASRWALMAATSAPDPVGRLGLLLGDRAPRERRELCELEAACHG